ncbi:hypothetical protein BX600DRAFT_513062 [Xylariales sp. PMI_506]|nr:hypothetical protein BX600DRAFT_513062 [Xylariales sp. PMI_506]
MAGTSPTRRSSRARTTQSQSQLSSATSSVSGRVERPTRAIIKAGSPQKSTGSGSLSSEPPEDSAATTASTDDNPLILRRRSTRGKDDDRKLDLTEMAVVSDDNDIQEDDEAVRCVCGFDDYPGLPPLDQDTKNHALKDSIDLEPLFSIEVTEDLAGFFVQCDVCKVWEHGLCMGIVNEDLLPDDYYCELCRKDLHKIYTASNGQKYSVYLPLHRPSRATSRATSTAKDGTRSPKPSSDRKSSRVSAAQQAAAAAAAATKRRSTMNSRDAAYDEEQLRRAIEISREEVIHEDSELPARRPKRGRDDDEEYVHGDHLGPEARLSTDSRTYSQPEIKRQRTISKSPSPSGEMVPLASREDSDDESGLRNGSKKSARNAARNQRERAERDERREEQERKRAEAASKRKGRAERRRADGTIIATATTIVVKVSEADVDMDVDSDPSDEAPLATRATTTRATESSYPPDPPPSSQPAPDTPPANLTPPVANSNKDNNININNNNNNNNNTSNSISSSNSTNTNNNKKKLPAQPKKKGRNQYTKDREGLDNEESPARSMSRDISRNQDTSAHEGNTKQNSKTKGGMNSKVTMSDMKRRANNILEFIQRTQVELANEPLSEKNSPRQAAAEDRTGSDLPAVQINGSKAEPGPGPSLQNGAARSLMKDFNQLGCVEMMDSLTRDLVKWQQEFAPS